MPGARYASCLGRSGLGFSPFQTVNITFDQLLEELVAFYLLNKHTRVTVASDVRRVSDIT